jgi:hypothetical protein
MKSKLVLLGLFFNSFLFSQENVLPVNGNVGIGTLTPSSTLDVNGDVKIDSTLIVMDSVVMQSNARIMNDMTIEGESKFYSTATFQNDVKLESVVNNSDLLNSAILLLKNDGTVSKTSIPDLTDIIYGPKLCPDFSTIITSPTWENGPNKVFIPCPQVNVGIGTANPTHNLHTSGDALFNSNIQLDGTLGIGTLPNSFSRVKIKGNGFGAGLEVDEVDNQNPYTKLLLMQYTNPTTEIIKVVNPITNHVPFLLDVSGKMTIHNGTTKIFQLNSDGLLQTRAVKVDVYNWPDYVFNDDYSLMPLKNVENYIQEHGHLPNVPSAEVAEGEGVDLSEMNKVLLQKIEELTLYLIQQEQRIQELENKK